MAAEAFWVLGARRSNGSEIGAGRRYGGRTEGEPGYCKLGSLARRQLQGLPPEGDLQRLEVERGGYTGPEERRDLADRLRLEGRGEPPLCAASREAASFTRASHSCSPTLTKSRASSRKRRCSPICACVRAAAAGITFVTVFPQTTRVSDQHGPWPGSPGCAQWHVGLPQGRYRLTSAPDRSSPTAPSAARSSSHRRSNSTKAFPVAAILYRDTRTREGEYYSLFFVVQSKNPHRFVGGPVVEGPRGAKGTEVSGGLEVIESVLERSAMSAIALAV